MAPGKPPPLLPPSERGASCAKTLLAALEDTELKPEVLHIVGVGDAELSLDFQLLAVGLPPGARVVLIGPHAGKEPGEELLGPVDKSGLQVSAFPQTYQRYLACCSSAEAPQFVVLFHPGLDIHFFDWYPCLKWWADARVPILLTAYNVPGGAAEKPGTVEVIVETLVGIGGGAGVWVKELENPHTVDEGSFNAGYFVLLGSNGVLPLHADEMYIPLYQALLKIKHPFAPRVGYLDVGDEAMQMGPNLIASIGEGAFRGAKAHDKTCDDETANEFAANLLNMVIKEGAGQAWKNGQIKRKACANCGDGYDSLIWHQAVCPAVGRDPLAKGDKVRLVNLNKAELNSIKGVLQQFNPAKQRWVLRVGDKEMLCKAVNLEHIPADSSA